MRERNDVKDLIRFLNETKIRSLNALTQQLSQVEIAVAEGGKMDNASRKTYHKAISDLKEISTHSEDLSSSDHSRIQEIRKDLVFIEAAVRNPALAAEAPKGAEVGPSKVMGAHRKAKPPQPAAQQGGGWARPVKTDRLPPMAKGLLQQSRSAKHQSPKSEEQQALEESTARLKELKALEASAEKSTFEIRIENPEQNAQIRSEAIEFAEAHGSVKADDKSVEADIDGAAIKVDFDDKGATVSVKCEATENAQEKAYNVTTEMVKAITNPDNTVSTPKDNTQNHDVQAKIEAEQASPSYEI